MFSRFEPTYKGEVRSPMSKRSFYSLLSVAVVGALLAIMLFPLTLSAQEADDGTVTYNENGTDPVRTFESDDPEGAGILWTVRGLDAADFTIDSAGVLSFVSSPDFEDPTDRPHGATDFNGDDTVDPGEGAQADGTTDNLYHITVSATEVWNGSNEALPARRTDLPVTVTVGNVDDDGELTLQWLQPEVDREITATLTDEDGGVDVDVDADGWTWYRSKVADPKINIDFHWNRITTETDATYQPAAADVGKYLWVRVAYTDTQGGNKTADVKSYKAVRAAPAPGDNGSPDFGQPSDTRTVSESVAVGADVGDAVEAIDPDPEDIVTYALVEAPGANAGDIASFNVDRKSGQLTVAEELDADAARGEGTTAGEYVVVVSATDPSGVFDSITVTITAENANEAPVVTGAAVLSVSEEPSYAEFNTDVDNANARPSEYVATQDDTADSIATWHLEGPDAGAFDLGGLFEPRYLNFKSAPDFENPTDANRDNVYEVTIVATDTDPLGDGAGVGRVSVAVVVENVEEAGEVVFVEGETAFLNETLVAQVHDADDHGGDLGEPYEGVHVQTWQWSKWDGDAPEEYETIEGETTNRYTPDEDDRGYFLRVTATYTDPFSADDDVDTDPEDERVTVIGLTFASNTDRTTSLVTLSATTENAVRLAPGPASAPMFSSASATRSIAENSGPGSNVGAPVTASGPEGITYSLEGPDAKYFNIAAMDIDAVVDTNRELSAGQITVGGDDPATDDQGDETTTDVEAGEDPELDFDDPAKKQTFSVTVKATGADEQTATVTVTINVTDVNEPPEVEDADGDPITSPVAVNYAEDDGGAVATYSAEDPEGLNVSWDLRGADASLFTIENGVLEFVSPPDFENPVSRSGDNTATEDATGIPEGPASDNVYSVIARAIAARASGDTGPAQTFDFRVDVTVTDANEDGTIVLNRLQPEVNDATETDEKYAAATRAITATLTDPDDPDGDVTPGWAWEVSETGSPSIDNNAHWGTAPGEGDETATYTPATPDEGKFLRVTATYSETIGDDPAETRTVRFMTSYKVQAAGGGAANQSPDFEDGTVELSVAESIAVGRNVGRVTASVNSPSATDRLTYGLRAATPADITAVSGVDGHADADAAAADAAAFEIDQATGWITTAGRLNFESRGTPDDGKYVVAVTVVDPSGLSDIVVVVITASDVNDNPVLSGRPELTIVENRDGHTEAGVTHDPTQVFDGNAENTAPTVNVYSVDDQDAHAGIARWELTGPDAGDLQLIGTEGRTLVFKSAPDYENPADADGDNVYKVTVVAIDNAGGRAEFDVCIAVSNTQETGSITLVDENGAEVTQPHAHGEVTAVLSDPDGGVRDVTWQWARSANNPPTNGDPTDIAGETGDSYTPTNDDTGDFLEVTAMYRDLLTADDGTLIEVDVLTDNSVLRGAALGRPPVFSSDGVVVRSVNVEVAENSPMGTYVGAPLLAATDPDGGRPTYELSGVEDADRDDSAFFELVPEPDDNNEDTDEGNTLQLRVVGPIGEEVDGTTTYHPVDLDNEDSDANSFTVVLTASDAGEDDATLIVNITVSDRNEAPSAPAVPEEGATTDDNNAPEFAAATATRTVAAGTAADENIGAPVEATDADDDTLTYTLGGADATSFGIDAASGQLMTTAASEALAEGSYEVRVIVSDGKATDYVDVTITVGAAGSGVLGDADGDGSISKAEVIAAFQAYVAQPPQYTKAQMIGIFQQYVDDNS